MRCQQLAQIGADEGAPLETGRLGCRLRLGVAPGTFDSFNPWIIKGNPAAGLSNLYDTLLTPSADEPFSEYGLLAKTVRTPEDHATYCGCIESGAGFGPLAGLLLAGLTAYIVTQIRRGK